MQSTTSTIPENILWVERNVTRLIYQDVINHSNNTIIYLVEAPAGSGKTILGRSLGMKLQSSTGYEPCYDEMFIWSGLLDIYDVDASTNYNLERRLIASMTIPKSKSAIEFQEYYKARQHYSAVATSGAQGESLEECRREIEKAFSLGLNKVAKHHRLVIALDTTERIEYIIDPVQSELQGLSDTTSLPGWLITQISQLHNSVVILLGRPAQNFFKALEDKISEINSTERNDDKIDLQHITLSGFDENELEQFFNSRIAIYPELEQLLIPELKSLLIQQTNANPLQLEIALQVALTSGTQLMLNALQNTYGLERLKKNLIKTYKNHASVERQTLLDWLAIARNGLSEELLIFLEGKEHAPILINELKRMEQLPFIKVRKTLLANSVNTDGKLQTVYFLHDTMYALCDGALIRAEETSEKSRHILGWYEQQINTMKQANIKMENRRPRMGDVMQRLLVESLFYRLRVNVKEGWKWYLQTTEEALRNTQAGLDMHLQGAFMLFLVSADPKVAMLVGEADSLTSPIDAANVNAQFPYLTQAFRLYCTIFWIKRYSARGKLQDAIRIGDYMRGEFEKTFHSIPDSMLLTYAEFLVFYGQAVMYNGANTETAESLILSALKVLGLDPHDPSKFIVDAPSDEVKKIRGARWFTYIVGRASNNLGFLHWLYQGRYSLAIRRFQQAIGLFRTIRDARLEEELANTRDNMGRVYIIQGREYRSIDLIRQALASRKTLKRIFRVALSQASLALSYSAFDQDKMALELADDAMANFLDANNLRGEGIGRIIRAYVRRRSAEVNYGQNEGIEVTQKELQKALQDAQAAVYIFDKKRVDEPIRAIHALNEVACIQRALHYIHFKNESDDAEIYLNNANIYFDQALDLAQKHHFIVEELDTIQDQAVLLARSERFNDAEGLLDTIRKKIPIEYHIRINQGLPEIPEEKKIDVYYQVMGKVELLSGYIFFERGRKSSGNEINESTAIQTMEAYLKAIFYMHRFSDEDFIRQHVYARLSKRFEQCPPDIIKKIVKDYLPKWENELFLPPELVRELLEDVFGALGVLHSLYEYSALPVKTNIDKNVDYQI